MSEFDKDDGQVEEVPAAEDEHPDNDPNAEPVDDSLEPDDVQDEEELEEVGDLDLEGVDVDNVPVLEEGADD